VIRESIGPYAVQRELGSGGMGTVYLVQRDGERFALKAVHEQFASTPQLLERFHREVAAGSAVDHPNVVRTLDYGQHEGRYFMVMEYVEGRTLRELLDALTRVPEALVREIARQASSGLAAIHASGIVHRDIKPDNILITDANEIRIMDLGVAKLMEATVQLTAVGQFAGSALYASPEQFQGAGVGPSADLYALGVVLYELATGDNPFHADELVAVIRNHLTLNPEPLDRVNDEVSGFLSAVVSQLLQKNAADRFETATELCDVLREQEASVWWAAREASALAAARPRVPVRRETALVGRDVVLAELQDAWTAASRGEGGMLVLSGEPGIGKTRLAAAFLDGIDPAEAHVLYGAFRPTGGLGGFIEAFVGHFGTSSLEPALSELFADTPAVVPALKARFTHEAPPAGAPHLSGDALSAIVGRLLQAMAMQKPVVFVVDDLHLARQEAQDMVLSLSRAAIGHRILLVGLTQPHGALAARLGRGTDVADRDARELGSRRADCAAHRGGVRRCAAGGAGARPRTGEFGRAATRRGRCRNRAQNDQRDLGARQPAGTSRGATGRTCGRRPRAAGRRVRAGPRVRSRPARRHAGDQARPRPAPARIDRASHGHGARARRPLSLRPETVPGSARAQPPGRIAPRVPLDVVRGTSRAHFRARRVVPGTPYAPRHPAERSAAMARARARVVGCRVSTHRIHRTHARGTGHRGTRHRHRPRPHAARSRRAARLPRTPRRAAGRARGGDRRRGRHGPARSHPLHPDAEPAFAESAELARSAGDRKLAARATGSRGVVMDHAGRHEEALPYLREHLSIAEADKDKDNEKVARQNLAICFYRLQRFDEAEAGMKRACALAQELGDRRGEAHAHSNLSLIATLRGEGDEARRLLRRSVELARDIGDRRAEMIGTLNLGALDLKAGHLAEAERQLAIALSLARETGDPRIEGHAEVYRSTIQSALGRLDHALERIDTAARVLGQTHDTDHQETCRYRRARLLFELGRGPEPSSADYAQQEPLIAAAASGDEQGALDFDNPAYGIASVWTRLRVFQQLHQSAGKTEYLEQAREHARTIIDHAPEGDREFAESYYARLLR